MVAQPGHIAHDVAGGLGRCHGTDVVDHVLDGDLQGIFLAHDGVSHGIADQNYVDSGRTSQTTARFVVGGHHDNGVLTVTAFTGA